MKYWVNSRMCYLKYWVLDFLLVLVLGIVKGYPKVLGIGIGFEFLVLSISAVHIERVGMPFLTALQLMRLAICYPQKHVFPPIWCV